MSSSHSINVGRHARLVVWVAALLALIGAIALTAPREDAARAAVVDGRTVSASLTVTEPGAVIDGLHVKGSIAVKADNVTIRNAVVEYGGAHSIRIYSGATGTRILDTTIQCTGSRTNGIVFGGYTAERVAVNDCRNDFMSTDGPTVVKDSTVDGTPFSIDTTGGSTPTPTPTQTSTPTPTQTSTPTPTQTSTPTPTQTSTPTTPPQTGEFPTLESTGPRAAATRTTGNLSSARDGEVIERVQVNGRLTVRHDNVTVRDVLVRGTGTYMVQVLKTADGTCPTNVRIEYTEIDGANAAENDIPLYSPECGYTFDHGYVHNVGRSSRVVNDTTISNSYIYSDRTGTSGAHRGAVGNNGGNNNRVINNVLMCSGTGCSAAIPMYGDFRPVNGMLVQHNLLATTGSYCTYGGSLSGKPYPDGSNIRFIDNHFSTRFFDTCGRYGTVSGFANNVRGNTWSGNVWHESGEPIAAPR